MKAGPHLSHVPAVSLLSEVVEMLSSPEDSWKVPPKDALCVHFTNWDSSRQCLPAWRGGLREGCSVMLCSSTGAGEFSLGLSPGFSDISLQIT